MRLPGHPTRRLRAAIAVFACALALAPAVLAQPVATEAAGVEAATPLSAFGRFELADAVLDTDLLGPDGNERARRELQMHLADRLGPWLAQRNAESRGEPPRLLRIEPVIVLLSYVDPAVRYAVGPVTGPEQLHVRVRFVDAATGKRVAEIELRADGSPVGAVAPLGATSSALPRRVAKALLDYLATAVAQPASAIATRTD
jgi:hypothetical protein